MPLYVYTLAYLLPNGAGEVHTEIFYLVLWMIGLLVPYILGLLVRARKVTVAEAILNWLVKPVLLLAFILFITLGLYINMYVFSVLDNTALIAGALIPFIGFGIGGGLMLLAKQGKVPAKTLSIESAIMNSIAVIVAIRFTLPQPDADIASAAAMWVLYVTPLPFVIMFLFHRIKKTIMSHFEKEDIKKEQEVTILSSFAAITQNAMQMGGVVNTNETQASSSTQPNSNENGDQKRLLLSRSHSFETKSPHIIISNFSFVDQEEDEGKPLSEDPDNQNSVPA